MYAEYKCIDDLLESVASDKLADSSRVATLKRYPIRFVLFDNFADSYAFIMRMVQEHKIKLKEVKEWLHKDYPDYVITHSRLAEEICKYIRNLDGESAIITPFSELARFYDNTKNRQFEALIRTIKAIESSPAGWEKKQRIYIPIVGLKGKMSPFFMDSQTSIWQLHSGNSHFNYRLILTNGATFGVKNLNRNYPLIHNVLQWLDFWRKNEAREKTDIICTSPSIFANAEHAQPDNAFIYQECTNANSFLTKGLCLDVSAIPYKEEDKQYWQCLAEKVDICKPFNLTSFVCQHFTIQSLDDYHTFIKLWFDYHDAFNRWLLVNTWITNVSGKGYLADVLRGIEGFSDQMFVSAIALEITNSKEEMDIRYFCMSEARKRGIQLSEDAQVELCNRLKTEALNNGYPQAISLFTPLTQKEKELAITWIGQGHISAKDVSHFYPELQYYLEATSPASENQQNWYLAYIDEYKKAKISDTYTAQIQDFIDSHNKSAADFTKWYQRFQTTANVLNQREDIDIYYWIDGLGIDWIPFVKNIVKDFHDRTADKIYVNETMIVRSLLPSITSINKAQLDKLAENGIPLQKLGDLDNLAHRNNAAYPTNIVAEIDTLSTELRNLLQKYSGKKIAIVSDHGISYLSQKVSGLNMAGFKAHHSGRYAEKKHTDEIDNENYFSLDDGKTVCALTHRSLGAKACRGCGVHGGCTPEEVLVPVIIISSSPKARTWSMDIISKKISGTNPVVRMRIVGLGPLDTPQIKYNGRLYDVILEGRDIYQSEKLILDSDATEIELIVGEDSEIQKVSVQTGAEIDDLFDNML